MSLKETMPIISSSDGVWEGWYRHYDANGDKIDEHTSRLLCRFLDEHNYHQTNQYFWPDGTVEIKDFPTRIENNKLVFFTHIDGWAAEVPLDTYNRTVMLNWTRHNEPDLYLYEMIQHSDCRKFRSRVWQWFRGGRLWKRTLIDEHFVSPDWAKYEENPQPPKL
jgi:hypothetical protein